MKRYFENLRGTRAKPIVFADKDYSGGRDNLRLLKCRWIGILNCSFHDPRAKGGITHNLILDKCWDVWLQNVVLTSARPRGDALNLFNSHRVKASFIIVTGPFEASPDVGRGACFDGTGMGGGGNILEYSIIPTITVAAGQCVLGPELECEDVQIGNDPKDDHGRNQHIRVVCIGMKRRDVWIAKGVASVEFR